MDPENSHLFAAMTAGMELPENVKGIVADCGFTVKMTYENYKTCVAPKKLFVVPDLLKK